MRQFFDPRVYRIIQHDQRGCGKSQPYCCLEDNTTQHLVEDIEKLRLFLNVGPRWHVVRVSSVLLRLCFLPCFKFGGSWGSTLALAYSQTHPSRCISLVLRGIFTLRKREIDWFYQDGASLLFPDAWAPYLSLIPEGAERSDLVLAYHKRLTSSDPS